MVLEILLNERMFRLPKINSKVFMIQKKKECIQVLFVYLNKLNSLRL